MKKKQKNSPLIILSTVVTIGCLAQAKSSDLENNYTVYHLKAGESFSQVVHALGVGPLYGPSGHMNKLLQMNRLTEEDAKKLNIGDALMIPTIAKQETISVVPELREIEQLRDEVKTLQAAQNKIFMPSAALNSRDHNSRHQRIFKAGYFYREQSGTQLDAKSQQNYKAAIAYRYRDKSPHQVAISPQIELGIFTQHDTVVEQRRDISVRYSPSYQAQAQLDFHHLKSKFFLAPRLEYEDFSNLQRLGQAFSVRRDREGRAGVVLGRYSDLFGFASNDVAWISLALTRSFYSQSRRGSNTNLSLDSGRLEAKAGSMIGSNWGTEFFYERYESTASVDKKIDSMGGGFLWKF